MAVDLPEELKIKDDELIECLYKQTQRIKEITDGYKVLMKLMSQVYRNQAIMIKGFEEVWEQLDGMEKYLSSTLKEIENAKARPKYKY